MTDDMPTINSIMELVVAYSPENLDLVEAVENAQDMLIDSVIEFKDFNPYELKILIEQGVSARLDILVGMIINLTASMLGWPAGEVDQEKKALSDGLALVKHHVERERLEILKEARGETG